NEYLLFSELLKTQNLYDLCDSYLIIGSKSSKNLSLFYDCDFTHFSSAGRKRQWRTMTYKPVQKDLVYKQSLFSNIDNNYSSSKNEIIKSAITQNLEKQEYKSGQLLAGLWLHSLVSEPSTDKFEQYILEYSEWLKANQPQFAGQLYDILPFNLIVNENGGYQVIDPEWVVDSEITPEFVLFRALFWFGFHNRDLLRSFASRHGLFSLYDFVEFGLKISGYQSDIDVLSQMETNIQSAIEAQFNKEAIEQTMRLPIGSRPANEHDLPNPKAQLFFYDSEESFNYENSVTLATSKMASPEQLSFPLTELEIGRGILRVDPVDRAGFFRISGLSICDHNGDKLWCLDSEKDIVDAARYENVVYADSHLGSLFIALNDDPQLKFDIGKISDLVGVISQAHVLKMTLTYYGGSDYNLAMLQLGRTTQAQQEFIIGQRRELESFKARYSELNDNFEFMKRNSEKQHALIEEFMAREGKNERDLIQLQTLSRAQSKVIADQLEMMKRTFRKRAKLLISRVFSKAPIEVVEPEEVVEEEIVDPLRKITSVVAQNNDDYRLWIKKHELNDIEIERIRNEIEGMATKPVFSIVVPVYNIDEEYLKLAVDSVRNQLYPYWELCLVDDASPDQHIRPLLKRMKALDSRIVIKLNKENKGIAGASNDALEIATGDYVGLLDHDDEISFNALYENAKVINEFPDVGFIYSDEDKIDMQGRRVDPFFKPDYSPDLLDSQNYICHFSVMSRKILAKIDGFRLGYDGSQDHDIIIRAIEHSDRVIHIPKVLYHWRKVPGSTAEVYDAKSYAWEAGRKAVAARLESSGEAGEVVLGPLQGTYQVKREILGSPKVSIIIPFKDRADLLQICLNSIIQKSSYQHYEIIGVSNNSEDPATQLVMEEYQTKYKNIRFVEKNVPFNFSQLCNFGVMESNGDYVLLLNNDIEVQSPNWLELLLEHAQRSTVGAVGGKLFFPDGRIQHAGIVAGLYGAAGHTHLYFGGDNIGYYGGLMVTRNVSAVTGAMLIVSRKKYDQVGGLDEGNLAVAYNDVDFCLKLLNAGYLNVFTPFCHAIHNESASRGYEDSPEKLARLEREKSHFVSKWREFLDAGDPFFNPNFDLEHFDFKLKL
nr:glycosyltransferase [Acidiferrobacterales bacterium]